MNQPTYKQLALAAQELNFSQQFSSLKAREIVDYRTLCNKVLAQDVGYCESILASGNADAFIRQIEANFLEGRQVLDYSTSPELILNEMVNPFLSATFYEDYPTTKVAFNTSFVANYVFQGYRTTAYTVEGMQVTPDNTFEIKNQSIIYNQDKFSIGFNFLANNLFCGFGLIAAPNNRGVKGKGRILLTALTENEYIIDDASKYCYSDGTPFPVELILKGLSL